MNSNNAVLNQLHYVQNELGCVWTVLRPTNLRFKKKDCPEDQANQCNIESAHLIRADFPTTDQLKWRISFFRQICAAIFEVVYAY